MTLAFIGIISIALFMCAAVAGAIGVILALLFGPDDEYDRELSDREQLEYLERWKEGKE